VQSESGVPKSAVTHARLSNPVCHLPSTWHFVAHARRLSPAPFHDFVESLKIGKRFPVGKKLGYLQSVQLFRHCRRHNLD